MKKFYEKIMIFVFILTLILVACDYLSMREPFRTWVAEWTDSDSFITGNVGSDEIKPYVYKVQKEDDTTQLIIGDSVCRQMFIGLQKYNEHISIVGSNAAITMAGQYILASEYIENHPEATDIYLIVLPESLCRTFDTKWGYQYTVMPFVETNTLRKLDDNTIKCMESVYGSIFMKGRVVETIDKSAINRKLYLNILKEKTDGYEQKSKFEIAEQYIVKMYELCKENGVTLHMYACPLADTRVDEIESMKNQYEESVLYELFPDFLEKVYYFPNEQAKDGVHFSGDYANQEKYNEKIVEMISETSLAETLNLF